MAIMHLSSPWVELYHKIQAMFARDPQVTVILDEADDGYYIEVYVADDAEKAAALSAILEAQRYYGNVPVSIIVYMPNEEISVSDHLSEVRPARLFEAAFKDNPALSRVVEISAPPVIGATYVVFANTVVQYFSDNLGDINGNTSTLYQEIAKDIFSPPGLAGVYYCTEVPDNATVSNGSWPRW